MAHKRPFDDEEVNEVSSKHQRQDGPGTEVISYNDGLSEKAEIVKNHDSDTFYAKGETSTKNAEVYYHDVRENSSCPDHLFGGKHEADNDAPRFASLSHWATSNISDEDEPSEEMVHLPYYSGCFSFDRSAPDDAYHCSLDHPPRKQVLVGPDHQAEIPPWGENILTGSFDYVNLNGTCILPNLETQPLTNCVLKAGDGRIDCRCPDQGSIRCARLHIAEERDRLSKVLSHNTFLELGFDNMGEVVADKWTNEEEQLFHEVVYSNPLSMGKNFWVALSVVFPSRTNMEIVSYYFNVFMLRKRAEQNKFDPMNIDSDNDEWQGNNDDDEDEDDDSGIESPERYDGRLFHQDGLHARDHEEDDGDVSDDGRETEKKNDQGHICKSDIDPSFQFPGKETDVGGGSDTQDGSCASSDSGASVQGFQSQNDGCHEAHDWHDYILDPTDGKSWGSYMNCPKNNVDFLPTCSMIEEIFGGDLDFNDERW